MIHRALASACTALAFLAAPAFAQAPSDAEAKAKAEAEARAKLLAESRAIAKDAAIYAYPLVETYRVMLANAVAKDSALYKAPFNQLASSAKALAPKDAAGPAPNTDVAYSTLWADLRAEPLVLTLPLIEKSRYFSLQFVDLYGYNFAYVGTRSTGNSGGKFLLAGPRWSGQLPPGVTRMVRTDTDFTLVTYRTQVFGPSDIENVKRIQAGYTVQLLSAFLGQPAPAAVKMDFPPWVATKAKSLGFFDYAAFVMQFVPALPDDKAIRTRMAQIGVDAGKPFKGESGPGDMKQALLSGMNEGLKAIDAKAASEKAPVSLYGSRLSLGNNYLNRAAGAKLNLHADSKEESFTATITKDADGKPLDGAKNRYAIKFKKDELPPVGGFWSLTAYDAKSQGLVDNPLGRYVVNTSTVSTMAKEADGSVTILLQKESPGKDKEAGWLPAPGGPMVVVLRTYWPKEPVYSGKWVAPAPALLK
jgi:hypothetical protein